ncbi:unnamed protein product, partial [marine sediment metagenome]
RAKDALWSLVWQFGIILLLAAWGWIKLGSIRWRVFFVAVILCDFVYTVFLNIISFEITPFGLPSCIVLAGLVGIGTAHVLKAVKQRASVGKMTFRAVNVAACLMPAIPLTFNYDVCDQSRNYTAYEHALNIFRTVDNKATLFLDGDNNLFPVTYARIIEKIREDVTIYDRPNLIFKMAYVNELTNRPVTELKKARLLAEKRIIEKANNSVYYAVFNPFAVGAPDGYSIRPYGIL